MKDGGLTKVHHVDNETFKCWDDARYKTIVYGE